MADRNIHPKFSGLISILYMLKIQVITYNGVKICTKKINLYLPIHFQQTMSSKKMNWLAISALHIIYHGKLFLCENKVS